ncbi:MAG: DUF6178 family protein [Desulfomonilaceae bacterium]
MKNSHFDNNYSKIVKTFDSFPLKKKISFFCKLSPLGRQAFLENLSEPEILIDKIAVEEIYFTIKSLGLDEADRLLLLTNSNQLKYILDLELWNRDRLDFQACVYWLNKIVRLGEDKLFQFLSMADHELLVTIFNKVIRVKSARLDIDLTEQLDILPPYTLDNIYFIDFREKVHQEAIMTLLQDIFKWNELFYFQLMQNLTTFFCPLEIEDMAYKWRNARLADKGFPDFEEALEIYRYLPSFFLDKNLSKDSELLGSNAIDSIINYPFVLIPAHCFFRDCLNSITDQWILDRISHELANLANKVIVADSMDYGEIEDLTHSLEKVSGYINIALQNNCGNDIDKGINLLRQFHMEILFRSGYSLIIDLQREARSLVKYYIGGLENMGNPLSGLLKGLFYKRPFYAENVLTNKKPRNFNSLNDIDTIRGLLRKKNTEDQWEPI